jgi:drug/metabolite transporter (DMT)-like permease
MRYSVSLLLLLAAAVLEAGGDALMRHAIHAPTFRGRITSLIAGIIVLAGYGLTVNAPPWEFGRLLGVYVVFFFLIAQLIAWVAFGQTPTPSLLVGGTFIIVGGVILSLG